MFKSTSQRSTGTGYTTTVTFLVVAFIFSPMMLLFARPIGTTALIIASACSVVCVGLAYWSWKRLSKLTIPTITEPPPMRTK